MPLQSMDPLSRFGPRSSFGLNFTCFKSRRSVDVGHNFIVGREEGDVTDVVAVPFESGQFFLNMYSSVGY